MRHRATVVLLAACLALAGCSSSDSDQSDQPTDTPAAATSAPAAAPAADPVAACADAITAGGDSTAPECADLSPDDYMKAIQGANQDGRDALQDLLDEASASAQ